MKTNDYRPAQIVEEGIVKARIPKMTDFGVKQPEGQRARLKRFTVFTAWPHAPKDYEEIDVDAINGRWAYRCAELELAQGYEPGWKIEYVEERFGLYM